ncbi:MAG: DegT/DnrJ/EryC1/StrS family aminotransferase, partial [Myxococcota bacterium]
MFEPIPFFDLPRQHAPLVEELTERVREHITRAAFIGGPAVAEFEESFASFCGTEGCVGVANGTEAVMLALMGAGVRGGHTVVLPSYTFIATAEAVSHLGARVRLVDCDPETFNIAPEALRAIDDDSVKAVIAVHLYGQPADMGPINEIAKEKGWVVVEDCAQSHGATYDGKPVGSLGDFGAFSFYPGKNMGAMGDAGAVVGPKGEALDRVRRVSNHGRLGRYEHSEIGVNSRLDSIQAMALSVKLRHIQDWNAGRARVADMYRERLDGLAGITLPKVHE